MIELAEPQVWTLIGVFSTMLFAVFAATTGYVVRTMTAGSDRVDAKFAVVDVKFDRVDDRFDHLDRDVQAISRRVFPEA